MDQPLHAQPATGPSRPATGFTLLELLVGIAVFALLSTLVLGGIRLGLRSWDAVAARNADSEQMRVVSRLLRRQLAGAPALAARDSGRWLLQFEGNPESLRFVSEFPSYVANGGVQVVHLEAVNDGGKKHLMLNWRPLHAGDDVEPQGEAVLVRNFSHMKISYFGAVDRNALPQWRDNWGRLRQMPKLVKIEVTTADGVSWPALIVTLRVDMVRFYKSPGRTPDNSNGTGSDGRT